MPRQKKINPAVLYFPERIQTALGYLKDFPLTVAHAPGGFGKTTALSRFSRMPCRNPRPCMCMRF